MLRAVRRLSRVLGRLTELLRAFPAQPVAPPSAAGVLVQQLAVYGDWTVSLLRLRLAAPLLVRVAALRPLAPRPPHKR